MNIFLLELNCKQNYYNEILFGIELIIKSLLEKLNFHMSTIC